MIGLDYHAPGISTDSARGPEATGNVWRFPDNRGTSTGLARSGEDLSAFRVHDRYFRRSGYRTSSPVTARPISIRWTSDVPSKMVKIYEGTNQIQRMVMARQLLK